MLYTCPATGPKNDTHVRAGRLRHRRPIRSSARSAPVTTRRSQAAYLRIGPVGHDVAPGRDRRRSRRSAAGRVPRRARATGTSTTCRCTPPAPTTSPSGTSRTAWPTSTAGSSVSATTSSATSSRSPTTGSSASPTTLAGPGTCAALHAAGVIEFPDAVAGATCKAVTEDPSLLADYGPAAEAVAASCRYGQALGEAERPLRGDELGRLGPRGRHPRCRRRAHRSTRTRRPSTRTSRAGGWATRRRADRVRRHRTRDLPSGHGDDGRRVAGHRAGCAGRG